MWVRNQQNNYANLWLQKKYLQRFRFFFFADLKQIRMRKNWTEVWNCFYHFSANLGDMKKKRKFGTSFGSTSLTGDPFFNPNFNYGYQHFSTCSAFRCTLHVKFEAYSVQHALRGKVNTCEQLEWVSNAFFEPRSSVWFQSCDEEWGWCIGFVWGVVKHLFLFALQSILSANNKLLEKCYWVLVANQEV